MRMINLKRFVLNVRALVVDWGAISVASCAFFLFSTMIAAAHRYAVRSNSPIQYSAEVSERVRAMRAWEAQLHPLLPNTIDHLLFGAWCGAGGILAWVLLVCIDHSRGREKAGRLASSTVAGILGAVILTGLSRLVYGNADWVTSLLAALTIVGIGVSKWDVVKSARSNPRVFVFGVGVFLWIRFGVDWEIHQWWINDPKKEGSVRELTASASAFLLVVSFSCFLHKIGARLDRIDRPSGVLRR